MESNGKRIDKKGSPVDFDTGPIIWGEPGTNGQHSFYQSSIKAPRSSLWSSSDLKKANTAKTCFPRNILPRKASLESLCAIDRPCGRSEQRQSQQVFPRQPAQPNSFRQRLDPYAMGALLAYYEHKVAFQGFIWNINSFDQEGVQLGKKLALKFIDQFALLKQGKPLDPKGFPLGAAYLKQIEIKR